jgi:hypothetical protein
MVLTMICPYQTQALLACSPTVHEHRHHPEVNHRRHQPNCLQGEPALSFLDHHLRFLAQALLLGPALFLRYHLVTPITTMGMVSWWRQHLLQLFMADQLLFCWEIWWYIFSAKSYYSEDGHREEAACVTGSSGRKMVVRVFFHDQTDCLNFSS